MPVSSPLCKEFAKIHIEAMEDVHKILDVGVGAGLYRDLLGDKYYWIGIEVWVPYISTYDLKKRYNEIVIGDVSKVELPEADLVIFGDVLEHLKKSDALAVFEKAKAKYKHIALSIPIGEYPQGAIDGNFWEEHKSTWSLDELNALDDWKAVEIKPVNPDLPELLQMGMFIK